MPFPVYYDRSKTHRRPSLPKRYYRYVGAALIAAGLLWFYLVRSVLSDGQISVAAAERAGRPPPLYLDYHQRELQLPQHSQDLPPPDDKDRKYFYNANHAHGSGWGNILQEMFMTTYLAYSAQRSFVFTNYTWNKDGSAYSTFDNGRKIPSQIPLSALITGPMVGGPMPIGSNAPRFVKKEWFDKVCPKAERTIIRTEDVTNGLSDASGQETLEAWVKKLDSLPDRCIEIAEDSIQVFSIWLFGSPRILDIFPGLSKSPIMANFGWSSLITSIYANNRQLFEPNTEQRVLSWFGSASSAANVDQKAMIPGLLVLHIRRGDFEGHCRNLAVWNSGFNGFNSFPELPDHFTPAPWHEWSETRPEHYDLFLPHCFPSIDEIVEKVQHIRKTSAGKGLRNVFIMTNGATEWVAELKQAMRLAAPWEKIASSRDMELTWEQKFVAQAADMLIGQKAQVFVGNGFSSLTSNIVMLRMAHGFAPESTRLW